MAFNFMRLIPFILVFLALYFWVVPMVGIAGGTLLALAFTVGTVILVGLLPLPIPKLFPFKLKRNVAMLLGIVLVGWSLISVGMIPWFSKGGALPAGALTTAATGVSTSSCRDSISAEVRDKASTISFQAWDLAGNNPYSAPVDLTTNCFVYQNGNEGKNYINTTTSTIGATLAGKFTVGQTIYVYCGGSGYYTKPVEGLCIDRESFTVNLDTYTAVTDTEMLIAGYDDTGSTALTSRTGGPDYSITLGADDEKAFYLKLTTNVADNAFNFGGWAISKFYNISSVEVKATEGRTYAQGASLNFLESIDVGINTSLPIVNITKDYVPWKVSSPILLNEWEWIKDKFTVKASAGSDPVGNYNSTFNGFAIVALDSTYARGSDGKVYNDVYLHTSGEGNAGIAETLTSPAGLQIGVLIQAV